MPTPEERWRERTDREAARFADRPARTGAKWFLVIVGVVIAIAILFGVIGWVGGWFSEAGRVTGVENTREQTTKVLALEADMVVAAQNVCDVEASGGSEKGDGDPTIIEDPVLAYKTTYRKLKADYDRRMGNFFEAYVSKNNPLPGTINHLPEVAPTLEERQAEVC